MDAAGRARREALRMQAAEMLGDGVEVGEVAQRLLFRIRIHRGGKGERRSMSERDYIGLVDAAHQQLKAPIIPVWHRLNTHCSKTVTEMIAAWDWLTVVLLPPYPRT